MTTFKNTTSTIKFLITLSFFLSFLLTHSQEKLDYQKREAERDAYEQYLRQHPFNNRPRMTPKEWKQKVDKRDRPDLAWEQDFLRTMDPSTRKPERERLFNYLIQQSQAASPGVAPGASGNNWVERGPNDIGGRTRAMAWDPTTANKVWAGGVTGGLWFNNNIHSSSSSWQKVNDFWDNIAVTAIAFDPNNSSVIYVGTGEGWGAGASIGGGIWKSTNGGSSFSLLTSTTSSGTQMSYVNDLEVRNESGSSVVYAAISRMFYQGQYHGVQGLYRSNNGGSSWSQVLPNVPSSSQPYAPADLEIDAGNRLWVGTRLNSFGGGGGTILYSDNGTTWTTAYTSTGGRRVELACAPSNQSRVYAIISAVTGGSEVVDKIVSSSNRGSTWATRSEPNDADNGIPSTDFSRGQAWYDLILRVDPNNANTVYAGAINWFKTTNGGVSWTQISKWSNNTSMNTLNIPLVHADQHAMEFKPGSSDTVIIGNDGGVYYSANLSTSTLSSLAIPARNNGYNVTQFYACALHPTSGNNHMLAGAQDNGTLRLNTAGVGGGTEIRGGDGAFCFIDQDQPNFQIASYVYNTYYLSTNGGASYFTTQLIRDLNTGSFINPADYDNSRNVLYAARSTSSLTRVSNVTGSFSDDTITVTAMNSMASALTVSPHATSSTTLFVGTRNGRLYKVTGANGGSPSTTRIDGSSFPTGSISCVEVGGSEDTLIVTLFNFGINSVWYTTNGGTNWVNKDNSSLPDMPIRWAMINPFNTSEVILATELGVWSTTDINASSPSWSSSSNGLATVRVDMLQMRSSDSTVMAATHGRGVFTSQWVFNVTTPPTSNFSANDTNICVGDTVTFTNTTSGSVTSRQWTFNGGTPSSSTAMHPQVVYNTAGSYTVSLISTNGSGSDTITRTNHIIVNSNPSVTLGGFSSVTTATAPFSLTGGTPTGGTYSGTGVSGGVFNPASAGAGTFTITYSFTNANGCSGSATSSITVTNAPPTAAFSANDTTICEGDTVQFTDNSVGTVTSRSWTFTGGSPSSSTATNPQVTYASNGSYTVRLIASNGTVSDTITKTNHITVNTSPNVTLGAFSAVTTATAPFALTGGSPTGGTYSGPGVISGNFDPSAAGVGTHTITYSFTNGSGCTGSATSSITVSTPTTVTLTLPSVACLNAGTVTLSGTPSGGSFSGPGVTGNSFDPVSAGVGTHSITYTVSGQGSDSKSIRVSNVTAGLSSFGPLCDNESGFTIGGGSPAGGVYKINTTVATSYDPAVQGPGTDTIWYVVSNADGCTDSVLQTITVHASPTVSLAAISNQCVGSNAFTLTGGSPGPGNYFVNGTVSTSFNPSSVGAGTHSIKYDYVNNNLCRDSAFQTVQVFAQPNVSLAALSDVCANDASFALTGGTPTGGNYIGQGVSAGFFDPGSVTSNNSYQITYRFTDNNSCTDSASQSILVKPIPIIRASNDTSICFGESVQLSAGGGNTYTWTPSAGLSASNVANPVATPFINTLYVVTGVTFNGCGNSDSVNIIVNPIPSVNAGTDITVCQGESFQLSGTGAMSYSWSPSNGLSSTTGANPQGVLNSSQTYVLTGTAMTGCSSSDSVQVNVNPRPVVSAGVDTSICEGITYNLQGAGATIYNWSPAMGLSATNVANPAYIVNGTMSYTLIGSNAFGCSDTDQVVITGKQVPSVSLIPFQNQCLDASGFVLNQGSPSGGQYSGPGVVAGLQFRPSLAGVGTHSINYDFTGTNGCTNSASANVTVFALPQVSISGLGSSYCENDPGVTLSLNPAGGSLSGPGIVSNSFVPNNAGVGTFSVNYSFTDSNSCSASTSRTVRVSDVPAVSSITGFKRVLKNRQYTYSVDPVNGASYQWKVINGALLAQANNVATIQWGTVRDGRIIVIQTSIDGCSDSTEAFILVGTVGEEEMVANDQILIYPNPARNTITIESTAADIQIKVYSIEAKLVYESTLNSDHSKENIDVESWPRGVYNVSCTSDSGTEVRRIVLN